jgi:hypothetical protein
MPTGRRLIDTKYSIGTKKKPASPYVMSSGSSSRRTRRRRTPGRVAIAITVRPVHAPTARSRVSREASTPDSRISLETVPLTAKSTPDTTTMTTPSAGWTVVRARVAVAVTSGG